MAPPNGSSKLPNGSGVARKSGSGPTVVPAIPLPYINRRGNHSRLSSTASRPSTNGSSLKTEHDAETTTPDVVTAETSQKGKAAYDADVPVTTNGGAPSVPSAGEPTPTIADVATPELPHHVQTPQPVVSQTAEEPDLGQPYAPQSNVELDTFTLEAAPAPTSTSMPPPAPPAAPISQPPPIVSPTRYAMPPSFQASRPPVSMTPNGDSSRRPRPGPGGHGPVSGHGTMHHPHPSNGSLQFGGLASDNSSPAPPHSGAFGPPPGMQGHLEGSRPPFHGHGHAASGQGFPHMMPYGTEFVPVTSADTFGRPPGVPVARDSYHSQINNLGPPTHSFQDSNSSTNPEDAGSLAHFPPPNGLNGSGNGEDPRLHHQALPQGSRGYGGPPPQRMMPGPMPPPPPHMMHPAQEHQGFEGWTAYLKSQFENTQFADCTLELRYPDDRDVPVRIPGHRLILARSHPLRALLTERQGSDHQGSANNTIILEASDRYLRSDAFWMAVQRLYAFPLLEIPEPSQMADGGLAMAGSADSRFDFALSYAAAGRLLEWHSVVVRGIEIASHLLSWSTLEKALEFALGDQPGRASADRHTPFTYGEPVHILMNGIVSFIIGNFPPFFQLDASTADPSGFPRIPTVPAAPPKSAVNPPIARGTSVHLNHNRRSRPTHIRFGDMNTSPSHEGAQSIEAHNLPPQQQAINTSLSRVLLNLPFSYLKPALESGGYGNVSGWANAEARHHIMRSVVAERESRRLRALDAVNEGRVSHAGQIRHALRAVEPRQGGDVWHILGWQEEILPYGTDTPVLGRQWVPLAVHGNESGPGLNQSPSYP